MEPQVRLKAALLDFDGTLVDLPIDWERLRQDVSGLFSRFGIGGAGGPLHASLSRAMESLKARGVSSFDRARLRRDFNRIMTAAEMEAAAGATERPGARDLLQKLEDGGWATIIQTSNSVDCVDAVLRGLSLPKPGAVVGRETTRYPKPHPSGVRRALGALGVSSRHAVVIGDGDFDIQLGRSIGARTIRMLKPDVSRTGALQADVEVNSLSEVADILLANDQVLRKVVTWP